MGADRRLYDKYWKDSNAILLPVKSTTKIEKGDLVFLNKVDGLLHRGSSSADYFAYPFSKLSGTTLSLASNRLLATQNFVGIASSYSDSGVSDNVSVHTKGLFKMPLKNSRFVKPLFRVIPSGSGTTLYNQKVAVDSGSTNFLGLATEYRQFASGARFKLVVRMFAPQFGTDY